MSFNDFILRAVFGDGSVPDEYEFVLLRDGAPLDGVPVPVVPRSSWARRESMVEAKVRFGPVSVPLAFDQVQVRGAGMVVDTFDVGDVRLPPGMVFGFTAEFDLPEA